MAILTKADIQSAEDRKPVLVKDVPGWGGDIYVRVMSGHERDAWEASRLGLTDAQRHQDIRASLIVRTACDESGNNLFDLSDLSWLTNKSAAALDYAFAIAAEVNGISDRDIEELEKNSESAPSV